ncbi:shikimate dehydrogenase [bacterium]|nr:MAG: shikimate dehydrogenase [bacterium]
MRQLKAAVVGDPVAHSLSPRLFAFWSKARGRDLEYEALKVTHAAFRETFTYARSESVWVGWNVTLPHKELAAQLSDELDASAEQPGAANVLLFRDGRAIGYNTDAQGFLDSLTAAGCEPFGTRCVVLGAGGAAAGVVAALRRSGAADVMVLNRTPERAASLAKRFGLAYGGLEGAAGVIAGADLVVNATAAGLGGGSPLPDGARFREGAWAVDLLYRPQETPFMAQARAAGARPLGGLGMLVRQGAAAWKLFFGDALGEPEIRAGEAHLEGLL